MRNLLLSASAFVVIAFPAFAWDAADTYPMSPAMTTAAPVINTASASKSVSKVTVNVAAPTSAAGGAASGLGGRRSGSASAGSGSGRSGGNSGANGDRGGSGGGVFLTIPDGHGEAPCGGGIGLGGGGSNAGGGVGGTLWEFSDCKRMRESAALDRMGFRDAAVAELCQIDRVRESFGGKCPAEESHLVLDVNAGKPDYCFTRNAGDLNQHRECNRLVKH